VSLDRNSQADPGVGPQLQPTRRKCKKSPAPQTRLCVRSASARRKFHDLPPNRWLSWARRCRIPAFVRLGRRISVVRDKIPAALEHGLSNALIESVNTKIRLLTRIAFGFRSAPALIALAMLRLGGHRPALPGRPDPQIKSVEPKMLGRLLLEFEHPATGRVRAELIDAASSVAGLVLAALRRHGSHRPTVARTSRRAESPAGRTRSDPARRSIAP
jgi:hypothetical protein